MRAWIFSTTLTETFLILRKLQRGIIKMNIVLHTKYPYSYRILMEVDFLK
jgi:hypothetical protein